MKKMFCILLVLTLLLAGCADAGQSEATTPATTEPAPVTTEVPTLPEITVPALDPVFGQGEGIELAFADPGAARISYTGNRSYVKYITSVQELPAEGQWQGYDEAFFEQYALVVVVETVTSGSVQLELERIDIVEGEARVSLKRTFSGDVGTTDMATWMLWARVEKGLDYTWTLTGTSRQPQGERY